MKKTYIIPQVDVIDLEYSGMLCSSNLTGNIDGSASDPAHAHAFDWDDEEDDW